MQGHTAGVNMAGGNEVFGKAIPMSSIGFFGLHIMTAGTYEGEMYEEKSDSTSVEADVRSCFILDVYWLWVI